MLSWALEDISRFFLYCTHRPITGKTWAPWKTREFELVLHALENSCETYCKDDLHSTWTLRLTTLQTTTQGLWLKSSHGWLHIRHGTGAAPESLYIACNLQSSAKLPSESVVFRRGHHTIANNVYIHCSLIWRCGVRLSRYPWMQQYINSTKLNWRLTYSRRNVQHDATIS